MAEINLGVGEKLVIKGPAGAQVEFNLDGQFPEVVIVTADGKRLRLGGIVDGLPGLTIQDADKGKKAEYGPHGYKPNPA